MSNSDKQEKNINSKSADGAVFAHDARGLQDQEAWLTQMRQLAQTAAAVAPAVQQAAHFMAQDPLAASVHEAMGIAAQLMKPYHDMNFMHSGILAAIEASVRTPELTVLHDNLQSSIQPAVSALTAFSAYANGLSEQWNGALRIADMAERSLAAQNLAVLKMLPNYEMLQLPYGSKAVLKSLTKTAAKELTQTNAIRFDPKDRKFYHKDTPEQKLTADQLTVVESALDLFADFTFDELASLESELMEDNTFAVLHPVGKRIFEIIQGWSSFVSFSDITYYHARALWNRRPYMDDEMMQAPRNVTGHGRYNMIGRSCYYLAETREGAIEEIKKHCGGQKPRIQLLGVKAVQQARIIDLSGDGKRKNTFLEHLRFTVENAEGKLIREYLLPNFVASCCKKVGIEGIRYRSTGYNAIVTWKDGYFQIEKGSREIVGDAWESAKEN